MAFLDLLCPPLVSKSNKKGSDLIKAKLFAAEIICDSYELKMTTFVEVTEHFFL